MTIPVILLPAEVQHPESAAAWALARIRMNAACSSSTDPHGGSEVGILDDAVWFAHYLVALARLTPAGLLTVDRANGAYDARLAEYYEANYAQALANHDARYAKEKAEYETRCAKAIAKLRATGKIGP